MTARRKQRIYWKRGRAYGDFRDYSDVGGRQEALVPRGASFATTDEDEARALVVDRLRELDALRERRQAGLVGDPRLGDYARLHLEAKRETVRESTFHRIEISLRRFVEYFGDPRLSEVGPDDIRRYIAWRGRQPGLGGGTVSPRTIRKELGQLANLYDAAVRDEQAARNVVLATDWPRVDPSEPDYFEPGEVARAIAAAFRLAADKDRRLFAFMGELVATLALTGGRRSEVYGLLRRDIDPAHDAVHFRPNRYRRLKTPRARRWVPLWPQLRGYLVPYLDATDGAGDALLFPGRKGMLTYLGTGFDVVAKAAQLDRKLRAHGLRHTYAATRMQTLDGGQPVSAYTVARELGHTNATLLEDLYGHLQRKRVRSTAVEYRTADVISIDATGLGA